MQYRCAYCLRPLGEYASGAPEPVCPDHPDGSVQLIPDDDGDAGGGEA